MRRWRRTVKSDRMKAADLGLGGVVHSPINDVIDNGHGERQVQ